MIISLIAAMMVISVPANPWYVFVVLYWWLPYQWMGGEQESFISPPSVWSVGSGAVLIGLSDGELYPLLTRENTEESNQTIRYLFNDNKPPTHAPFLCVSIAVYNFSVLF